MKYFKTHSTLLLICFLLPSCSMSGGSSEVPFTISIPEKELTHKNYLGNKISMLVPEGSKVKQQRREMKLLGQAGKFDPKGAFIEGSAVYDWEIQLYDEESEIEYQESLNTAFKGKGLTRPVGKWNEIRRFDLPAFLSNYPGGKQSMFRLDHKNAEGKYVARIVLYCNDGLLKTDQNQRAARLQIHQMLESIKLHP